MKKIFFLLLAIAFYSTSFSQSKIYIRGDSIYLQSAINAELILLNSSRLSTGAYLKNVGNGRTRFSYALDSVWVDGDSIRFRYGPTTIAVSGTPDLSGYELLTNKATDFSVVNNTKYPTTQAVSNYITAQGFATTTDLSGYVPTSRTLTINGTTYDLSANRSWTISTTPPLSSITAAATTNTINNANHVQEWQWNALTGDGLKLTSSSTTAVHGQTVLNVNTGGANANSNLATYGLQAVNTHTGTLSENYGIYASATGASNANIAIQGSVSDANGIGVYGASSVGGKGVQGFNSGSGDGGYFFNNSTGYALRTGVGRVKFTEEYILSNDGADTLATRAYARSVGGGGGGSGTVTDFIFTDGNGFDGTVSTSTTTPTLSLTSTVTDNQVFVSNSGALSGDANFTWNGSKLNVAGVVAVNSPNADASVDLTIGNIFEFDASGVTAYFQAYDRTAGYRAAVWDALTHEFKISGGGTGALYLNSSNEVRIAGNTDHGDYKLQVSGNVWTDGQLTISTQFTPANSTDATHPSKTLTVDDTYLYYRTSGGTWKKIAWATF
jgi:hypothetical protein